MPEDPLLNTLAIKNAQGLPRWIVAVILNVVETFDLGLCPFAAPQLDMAKLSIWNLGEIYEIDLLNGVLSVCHGTAVTIAASVSLRKRRAGNDLCLPMSIAKA